MFINPNPFLLYLLNTFQISIILLSPSFPQTISHSLNVLKKPNAQQAHGHDNHQHKDSHVHKVGVCETPHYGEDPYSTKKLVILEEKLAKELSKFVVPDKDVQSTYVKSSQKICQQYLSKYLKDYNEDNIAIQKDQQNDIFIGSSKADVVVQNPIFTVKLLRRLVSSLLKKTLNACKSWNKAVEETVMRLFEREGLPPPTPEELERAYGGLIAVTFIHGINITSDMRNGKLGQTSAQLKFEDFIGLANTSLSYDDEGVLSYHWLNAASETLQSEGEYTDNLNDFSELDLGFMRLMNITGIKTPAEVFTTLKDKWQSSWQDTKYEHESLCREEYYNTQTSPIGANSTSLDCFYKSDYFMRYKVQVMSYSPLILQFHDFLTEKEIEFIRNDSPARVIRPEIVGKRDNFKSDEEFEKAFFAKVLEDAKKKNKHPVVTGLVEKVKSITQLDIANGRESLFEMTLHTPLSQYWNVEVNRGTALAYNPELAHEEGSDSFASFLMFLTEVHVGGVLTFPELNVIVKPKRGSAILIVNYNEHDVLEDRIHHENCPVILGTIEAANIPLLESFHHEI